ncbi:hypothetical protein SAMD00019534_068020, partial [Acytostelium subglobosum LB1]|uniref:hypothetical protein n=1 Tax=Acytostelium subglobosum LB1 TaxID=1410327 RepID=UPI000644C45C
MSWLQKTPKMNSKRMDADLDRPLRRSDDNSLHPPLPSIVLIGGALSNNNLTININHNNTNSNPNSITNQNTNTNSNSINFVDITTTSSTTSTTSSSTTTPTESPSTTPPTTSTTTTPSSPVLNAITPKPSMIPGNSVKPDSPQPLFFLRAPSPPTPMPMSLSTPQTITPASTPLSTTPLSTTTPTPTPQQATATTAPPPIQQRPRVSNVPPAIVKLPPLSMSNNNRPQQQQQQHQIGGSLSMRQRTTPIVHNNSINKSATHPLTSTTTTSTSSSTMTSSPTFKLPTINQRTPQRGSPGTSGYPQMRGPGGGLHARGRGGPNGDSRRRGITVADSDKETETRKIIMIGQGQTRPRSKSLEVLNSWDYQPWEARRDSADEAQPVAPESPRGVLDHDSFMMVDEMTKKGHKSIHFKSPPIMDAGGSASPRTTRDRATPSPNRPATPSIVFELNDENQPIVTSGTKDQLMDYLCNKNKLDLPFVYSFMLTFTYFMDPEELFDFLIRRYESNNTMDSLSLQAMSIGGSSAGQSSPVKLSNSENNTIDSIRQNVIIVFLVWIDSNYSDFDDNESLAQRMVQFSLRQNSKSLKEAIDKQKILRINTEVLFDTMRADLLHTPHYSHSQNGASSSSSSSISASSSSTSISSLSSNFAPINQPINYLNNNIKLQTFYAHQIQEWTMLHLAVGANAADVLIQRLMMLKKIVVVNPASKESKTRLQREDVLQLLAPARESYPKSFLDYHPHDLVKQLTLIEFTIFQRLRINELYNKKWTMPKTKFEQSPNVMALITMSNRVANWVATEIVTTPHPKKRVEVMKRFITMAEYARKIKNYNTMMEIISGLTNCSVTRLRDTWRALPSRYYNSFRQMAEFFNTNENWKQYRAAIKLREQPCLPYLGLFLQDINFLEEGNPNFVQHLQQQTTIIVDDDGDEGASTLPQPSPSPLTQHVNFKKLTILANFFKSIIFFQKHPYASFINNTNAQSFLDNDMLILPEKELNDFSKFVESPTNPLNKLNKSKLSSMI